MSESSNKIIALHGVSPTFGEEVPEVIAILENWLAEARRGEVSGIMIAGIDGSGRRVSTDYAGGKAQRAFMLYGANMLHSRIQRLCFESHNIIPKESA